MCDMNLNASAASGMSTRLFDEPSDAPDFARKPVIVDAASSRCVAPSACFFVQPAPATNRSFASGLMVDSPPPEAATRPFTFVREEVAGAGSSAAGSTPAFAQISAKSEGSVTITHGRAARENVTRMRWR